MHINRNRLLETIATSASIGRGENGGIQRLALTAEDQQMRNQLKMWMEEEQLNVRIDDFGNMYGRRKGRDNHPAILIGSHLDTQPHGGKYDGIIGVLGALEVIRTLNEHGVVTNTPIEIVNFTNEEGARFAPPLLGSSGLTANSNKERIYQIRDRNGTTFHDALAEIGYIGDEKNRIKSAELKYFIELHIEQGPRLDQQNKSIGIVRGIEGISWLKVTVEGEMNHAGPTPMEARKDALVASSKMVLAVNELAKNVSGLKVTVGELNVMPNVPNVIPGMVTFIIDVRHESDGHRLAAEENMREKLSAIAALMEIGVTIETLWEEPTIQFHSRIIEEITTSTKNRKLSTMEMYSGPSHDAKNMAKLCKAGMIFVPSVNGVSHNEAEFTHNEDIVNGVNTLLDVTCALSNAKT